MSKNLEHSVVFESLKTLFLPYAKSLEVVTDSADNYYLDTHHIMKNKKPLFFGAVNVKKNYVSYHLMPVYVNPSLLDSMSDALKKRMQGKSCFNFKSIETDLIDELAALTKSSYQYYIEEGYIQSDTEKLKQYFEDFEEGFTYEFKVPGLTVKEITDFAEQYDPQLFHLDEAVASKSHFGGLVASGFQTQLKCFVPFCRGVLLDSGSMGAPGIEKLKWLRPWYPGEVLNVCVTLVSKRVSSKRNDRGYLNFELMATTDSSPLLSMEWASILLTREGASE